MYCSNYWLMSLRCKLQESFILWILYCAESADTMFLTDYVDLVIVFQLKLEHGGESTVQVVADSLDPQLLVQQILLNLVDADVQSLDVHD